METINAYRNSIYNRNKALFDSREKPGDLDPFFIKAAKAALSNNIYTFNTETGQIDVSTPSFSAGQRSKTRRGKTRRRKTRRNKP